MELVGRITSYDGETLTIKARVHPDESWILEKQRMREATITIPDGRKLSPEQRKMVYALLRDMADFVGNDLDWEKQLRKYHFIVLTGCEEFSLSNVDMTTANRFIDYLLDECFEHDIPLSFRPLERLNDAQTGRWIYRCMVHRKCCICGKHADIHHEKSIGMGRNRNEICHVGMKAIPLCREHHTEAHDMGKQSFSDKYHIFGVKLDGYLVKKLRLGVTTTESIDDGYSHFEPTARRLP